MKTAPAATMGRSVRYGLASWLHCAAPADGCAVVSSPGAFGFTPWVDRSAGYYAIIADPDGHNLEVSHGQEVGLAVLARGSVGGS